jgi:hypothetical protein
MTPGRPPPRPIGRRPDGGPDGMGPTGPGEHRSHVLKERAVTLLRPAPDRRATASGGAPAPGFDACGPADPVLCGLYKVRAIGCKARVSRDITVLRRGWRTNQDFWRERGHQDPRAGGTYRLKRWPDAQIPVALGAFGLLYRRRAAPCRVARRGVAAPFRPRGGRPARA